MPEEVPTTVVDITDHTDVRRLARGGARHPGRPGVQVLVRLPPEVMASIQPHDDYRLAFTGTPDGTVTAARADGTVETDLFAGVDTVVTG